MLVLAGCRPAADPLPTLAPTTVLHQPIPTPTEERPAVPTLEPAVTPTKEVAAEAPAVPMVEALPTQEAILAPLETLEPAPIPVLQAPIGVRLEPIAQGLAVPAGLVSPPDDSGRLFVIDQIGLIYTLGANGRLSEEPFLDLRERTVTLAHDLGADAPLLTSSQDLNPNRNDEQGLTGLAFHPNFAENGRFFVYYSTALPNHSPIGPDYAGYLSEFTVSSRNPNLADAGSERILMQLERPHVDHDGGQLLFGRDGYLYLTTSPEAGLLSQADRSLSNSAPLAGKSGNENGAGSGDFLAAGGVHTSSLIDNVLRIDVDGDRPYAIPVDNPFVDQAGDDEIYLTGLRNPFGLSLKIKESTSFRTDVDQDLWQSLDKLTAAGSGVDLDILAGRVYRGTVFPSFEDHFVFGDRHTASGEGDGRLFIAAPPAAGQQTWSVQELVVSGRDNGRVGEIVRAIGRDSAGELYVLTSGTDRLSGSTGKVYKLMPYISARRSVVEDPLKYLPQNFNYARIPEVAPLYRNLDEARAGRSFRSHGDTNFWVNVVDQAPVDDQTYYYVRWGWDSAGWISGRHLRLQPALSPLKGVDLLERAGEPLALVYRPVHVRSLPGVVADETVVGYLEPYSLVSILETRHVAGTVWYRIGPDQWSHGDFLRPFVPAVRPQQIGPDEKWVEVNLAEQVVIAHVGDTPVFATLTATGRRGYETDEGLFRVWSQLRDAPMEWLNSRPPYSLANVPWIMYFNQSQGFHGTYWHDAFGTVRSAGCVNLSPHDARWLFNWVDLKLAAGQRIKYATLEEPGVWVWVHSNKATADDLNRLIAGYELTRLESIKVPPR
jgi:glucose/arabinose dehydrogenase